MLNSDWNWARTWLKSTAPSPKYHEGTTRLGDPDSVVKLAPAGNSLDLPPVLPPNPPPPKTSNVHFGSFFTFGFAGGFVTGFGGWRVVCAFALVGPAIDSTMRNVRRPRQHRVMARHYLTSTGLDSRRVLRSPSGTSI